MLRWIDNLYVSSEIRSPEEWIRKVNERKGPAALFLLTLPANPANVLEIVPAMLLRQPHMYENCQEIIGMALGKSGAVQLSAEILEKCYNKTGAFRLEEYIKNR